MKMKTTVFVFLIIFCLSMNVYSQNRIHGWDTEKITSIRIEFLSPNTEQEILIFNTKQDIDKIISFLKNVEFKEIVDSNLTDLEQPSNVEYKIVFQGQRDQVYLYENSACIGKTSFIIDSNVIVDFGNLIKELQT